MGKSDAKPHLPNWPRGYHRPEKVFAYLQKWAAEYPGLVQLDTLATTHENRPVYAVRVSDHCTDSDLSKPEVLYVGATHGCEPLSVEVSLRLIAFLLSHASDPQVRDLLQTRSLWFVPVFNPDGLHQYYQGNFIWKANRKRNKGHRFKFRHGVDLNRNFGYEWGCDEEGSRSTPGWFGFGSYRGPAPFSEPESQGMRDFVSKRRFSVSFSFHSFGEKYLYPYNYGADPADLAWYQAFTGHLGKKNGYSAGNPVSGEIYKSNGDMDDWLYGDHSGGKGKTLAMTVEIGKLYLLPWGNPEKQFKKNVYGSLLLALIAGEPALVLDSGHLKVMGEKVEAMLKGKLGAED
ncbi:MAG: hypothetical protein H6581_30645 [Bacteroidia bacterium]|nr:hypothetical protein [Bacteroidia bacterium]